MLWPGGILIDALNCTEVGPQVPVGVFKALGIEIELKLTERNAMSMLVFLLMCDQEGMELRGFQ